MDNNEILDTHEKWAELKLEIQKLKDENSVIIQRLDKQAKMVDNIQDLSVSVSLLANNMKAMLEVQEKQSDRLNKLEQKPAKKWESVTSQIINLVIGAILGFIFISLGLK